MAAAETREEALKLIHEAISLHLAAIPIPDSYDFPTDDELRRSADAIFMELED